jgi:hypothetical protein
MPLGNYYIRHMCYLGPREKVKNPKLRDKLYRKEGYCKNNFVEGL